MGSSPPLHPCLSVSFNGGIGINSGRLSPASPAVVVLLQTFQFSVFSVSVFSVQCSVFSLCLQRSSACRPSGCLRQAIRPAPADTYSAFQPFSFSAFRLSFDNSSSPDKLPAMAHPEHHVAKSVGFLADDPDLLLAIVFGSAVSGNLRPDSDIDVAIYPRRRMDHRER